MQILEKTWDVNGTRSIQRKPRPSTGYADTNKGHDLKRFAMFIAPAPNARPDSIFPVVSIRITCSKSSFSSTYEQLHSDCGHQSAERYDSYRLDSGTSLCFCKPYLLAPRFLDVRTTEYLYTLGLFARYEVTSMTHEDTRSI